MPSRAQLEHLLDRDPDDAFLNFGLAMAIVKEGRTEEALARFDRVLDLDSTYIAAYLQKGVLLSGVGRREDAAQAFRDGISAARAAGDRHAADEMQKLLDALG